MFFAPAMVPAASRDRVSGAGVVPTGIEIRPADVIDVAEDDSSATAQPDGDPT